MVVAHLVAALPLNLNARIVSLRATIFCNAVTMSAPITTGSMHRCGVEP